MTTKDLPQNGKTYICEDCDYKTLRKSSYEKHLTTEKHKNNVIMASVSDDASTCVSEKTYNCNNCSKTYLSRTGLWFHKKKCEKFVVAECSPVTNVDVQSEIVKTVMNTVQHMFAEQTKTVTTLVDKLGEVGNITNTTNSHNNIHNNQTNNINNHQTFNLNFFLNETCKNAMNLTDFIDQIEITMEDLENIRLLGYSDGVSSILVKNFDKVALSDRPIHSNDVKREKFYIRDKNKWVKETENYQHIINAIKAVVKKNTKQLMKWRELNPDYKDSTTKTCDIYHQMIINMYNGSEEEALKNYERIIKNIAANVPIPKHGAIC